jgi:hypothetical protein
MKASLNNPGGKINILGHSKQKCSIPNGFQDGDISLYSSLDLEPNTHAKCVERQLAVVTIDSDIVGVLQKMPNMLIRCPRTSCEVH